MKNKFDDFSAEELLKMLEEGFLGSSDDLSLLVKALKDKGAKEATSDLEDKDLNLIQDYFAAHENLPEVVSKKEMKKAIQILKDKKSNQEELEVAIMKLAHAGDEKALKALQRFAKGAKGSLKFWAETAMGECELFIESEKEAEYSQTQRFEPETTATNTVASKVITYVLEKEDEMRRAVYEFLDGEVGPNGEIELDYEEEGLMMDWLVYDFRLSDGRKPFERFAKENRNNLSKKELEQLEEMHFTKYGFFEVLEIKIDKWIDLLSLQSGKKYRVREKMGTRGVEVGEILICRIGKINKEWRMVGSNPMVVPPEFYSALKASLPNSRKRLTPKDGMTFRRKDNPERLFQ